MPMTTTPITMVRLYPTRSINFAAGSENKK